MGEHYHYTWCLDENNIPWEKPKGYKNTTTSETK